MRGEMSLKLLPSFSLLHFEVERLTYGTYDMYIECIKQKQRKREKFKKFNFGNVNSGCIEK